VKRLEVIYEDDTCVVINKPAGLAVQGGKGIGISLDSILEMEWGQRPFLVHRLDRDTSGLILVAKTKEAAAAFSRLLGKEKSAVKRYIAVCKNRPPVVKGSIVIDLEIRSVAKKSITGYRLLPELPENSGFSMLELELETGRMHQIRRHLAMIGIPVLGDDKYGDFTLNKIVRKTMNLRHLLLHSSRLIIPQSPNGKRLDLTAPLPDYFRLFVEKTTKSLSLNKANHE
jgi:23S rRNA pseudouridine955/2504/2580 synthase